MISHWFDSFGSIWSEASDIWISGGWAMIAIAVIALLMFALGTHIYLRLIAKGFRTVPEGAWKRWLEHPSERTGPVGKLLDKVGRAQTIDETTRILEQVRVKEAAPFERDLWVMKICVGAAPLVGLLGTVTGMLTTFGALASGSGGDQTMGMVASGISEALITTETGLVIAIPGLFFQYQLGRNFERYKAFLAQIETFCTQTLHRKASRHRLAS